MTEIKTLLVVEDPDMTRIVQELVDPNVQVVREYNSTKAAVERIKGGKIDAVLTGWKIRKSGEHFDIGLDELAAPAVVAAAKDKNIPSAVITSHPEGLSFKETAVINKTTSDLEDLATLLKAMLSA